MPDLKGEEILVKEGFSKLTDTQMEIPVVAETITVSLTEAKRNLSRAQQDLTNHQAKEADLQAVVDKWTDIVAQAEALGLAEDPVIPRNPVDLNTVDEIA